MGRNKLNKIFSIIRPIFVMVISICFTFSIILSAKTDYKNSFANNTLSSESSSDTLENNSNSLENYSSDDGDYQSDDGDYQSDNFLTDENSSEESFSNEKSKLENFSDDTYSSENFSDVTSLDETFSNENSSDENSLTMQKPIVNDRTDVNSNISLDIDVDIDFDSLKDIKIEDILEDLGKDLGLIEEKPKYIENKLRMIYVSVYYVEEMPNKKTDKWKITPYYAPITATSEKITDFDKTKYDEASTVCRLSYAKKTYNIYGADSIARYGEFLHYGVFNTHDVECPQIEITKCTNGYKYIGHTFEEIKDFKYAAGTKLPHAKCEADVKSDDTITQYSKSDKIGSQFVYSIYFYKPSTMKIISKNPEYGRFASLPDAKFSGASHTITTYNIQMGFEVELYKESYTNLVVKVTGINYYVEDYAIKERPTSYYYYYILNDYCHLAKTNFTTKKYVINKSGHTNLEFEFSREVFNITFDICSNVTNAENLEIDASFGYVQKQITLLPGNNVITTVTIENIPAGVTDVVMVGFINSDKTKHYTMSNEPLTEFTPFDKVQYFSVYNELMTIEKSVTLTDNQFYLTELFEVTVDSRIDKNITRYEKYYKVNDVDFNVLALKQSTSHNDFDLSGFSLSENSIENVTTLTENKNTLLYANWKKTLSATIYVSEIEPYGKFEFTKDIYNFDNTTTLQISKPNYIFANELVGYTQDVQNTTDLIQIETSYTASDGDEFFAVYKFSAKITYATYNVDNDENIQLSGDLPQNYETTIYNAVKGNKNYVEVTIPNTIYSKSHFTFWGWCDHGNPSSGDLCYTDGDIVKLGAGADITLYPILVENLYPLKINLNGGIYSPKDYPDHIESYDETTNELTVMLRHNDVYYFPNSTIKRPGYKTSGISAEIKPENLTEYISNSYYYKYIDQEETINIYWELDRYKVNVKRYDLIPTGQANFDISVNYSYFDIILNEQVSGEIAFSKNDDFIEIKLPMNTELSLNASINQEEFNLAFAERPETPIANKTCSYSYKVLCSDTIQNVVLFITKLVKINLVQKGSNLENETEVIYKYFHLERRLPRTLNTRDGYELYYWCAKEDGLGTSLTKINYNINDEFTVYAIWRKYAKFYINNSSDCFHTMHLLTGDTYSASSIKSQRVEKDGVTYQIAGFTTNPNSLTIEYNGTDTLTLTDSICWYAVLSRYDLTKTESEQVTATFHLGNNQTSTQDTTRYITYSSYPTYYNIDLTISDDSTYKTGRKSYTSEKLEFVHGTYDKYIVYGWNENGDYTDDYFTEDDDVYLGKELDLYPIFRDGIQTIELTHTFYFSRSKYIERTSYAYGLLNTFKIYGDAFTHSETITDEKEYTITYDKLSFDDLINDNPNKYQNHYKMLGWTFTPYGLNPTWTDGDIDVTDNTSWYAVWERKTTKNEELKFTHTFVFSESKSVTVTTERRNYIKDYTEILNYDYTISRKTSDGYISNFSSTKLPYYTAESFINEYGLFEGWSTDPNSTKTIFNFNNRDSFEPNENLTLYPVYSDYYYFNIIYKYEGLDDYSEIKNQLFYYNFTKTIFRADTSEEDVSAENLVYNMQITNTAGNDKADFLGWLSADDNQILYQTGQLVQFKNFENENTLVLSAKIIPPETVTVTFRIEKYSQELTFIKGEEITLEDLNMVDGFVFCHWESNDEEYESGSKVTASSNLEFTAVYMTTEEYNRQQEEIKAQENAKKKSKTIIIIVSIVVSLALVSGAGAGTFIFIKKKKAKK